MSVILQRFQALFFSFFLTFSNAGPLRYPPSVQPIFSPDGITFCTAFSVNERQRLYVTAAHCVDNKDVDLPIPLMFSQRIRVLKADHQIDIAIIQAALGTPQLQIAEQPPGPGADVVAVGFPGGQEEGRALLSTYGGTFTANAIGVDEHRTLHVFSVFHVRAQHGMSGGPILDEEGKVVSVIQLKFPNDVTGGVLLQFLTIYVADVK